MTIKIPYESEHVLSDTRKKRHERGESHFMVEISRGKYREGGFNLDDPGALSADVDAGPAQNST